MTPTVCKTDTFGDDDLARRCANALCVAGNSGHSKMPEYAALLAQNGVMAIRLARDEDVDRACG